MSGILDTRMLTFCNSAAQLAQNRKSYQLFKLEIEFNVMEEIYAALRMCTCAEKTTFLGKDDYSIVEWGRMIIGEVSPQSVFPTADVCITVRHFYIDCHSLCTVHVYTQHNKE